MKGLRLFLCTFLMMSVCCVWASEYSVRNYLDSHKGSLHPVEGIWQSTDGYKYGIISTGAYGGSKTFGMEILAVPSLWSKAFRIGEKKGTISEGSTNGVYSLEYRIKYVYADGTYIPGDDETENILLIQESSILMSFQRLDGKKYLCINFILKMIQISLAILHNNRV